MNELYEIIFPKELISSPQELNEHISLFQEGCLSDDETLVIKAVDYDNTNTKLTVELFAEDTADIDQMLFSLTFDMQAITTKI